MTRTVPLVWSVGPTAAADSAPSERVPATVPGAVQLDWARAKGLPDHHLVRHVHHYRELERLYWSYQALLELPAVEADETVYLVCLGVDDACTVRINGRVVLEHTGCVTPFELALGDARSGDSIEIVVHPAPTGPRADADHLGLESYKAPVGYGTDFHPRLVPLGLCDETYVEIRPRHHLRNATISYELDDALSAAQVTLVVEASAPDAEWAVQFLLFASSGQLASQSQHALSSARLELTSELTQPELWWPNGEGAAVLYRAEIRLLDATGRVRQQISRRVGFRRLRLVRHEGWDVEPCFPFTQLDPPITVEVNGRRIFAKGSNFAPVDVFLGTLNAARYHQLLDAAVDANLNLLRVWGGAAPQKRAFYDACDERGLMVWQDFMLSSQFLASARYLSTMETEVRSTILKLRQHACLLLWCGGNELLGYWHAMSEQDPALRLAQKLCYELDPGRPFLLSTPVTGMAHGSYVFRELSGREPQQIYPAITPTALPEFGVPGPADVQTLESIIPEEELFPPRPGTAWEGHFAFNAWRPHPGAWLNLETITHYFGAPSSLQELVDHGQLLQAEGLKFAFEEARRQKPRCSLAMNWCFGEPWPCAANGSLIGYPFKPKPALNAVKAACRPSLASARATKFGWRSGETFTFDLYLLNDAPVARAESTISAVLRVAGHTFHFADVHCPALVAGTNWRGPTLETLLPVATPGRMVLTLTVLQEPSWSSAYTFAFLGDAAGQALGSAPGSPS